MVHAAKTAALDDARYFSREIVPIAPHTPLAQLQNTETELAQSAVARDGAVTAVTAFEPTTWSLVRARLWREKPALPAHPGAQIYVVGYLATASK